MPRKGFKNLTLKDNVITFIDSLVDEENEFLNSRSKVVEKALQEFKDSAV